MKRRRNSQEIPEQIQKLLNQRNIGSIAQGIFLADSIGIDGDTLIQWMQRYAPVFINLFGYNLTRMDELAKETILLLLEYFSDSAFFQSVSVIDLSQMKLERLPDEIGNLENLRELWLEHNNLTELPDSIGNLGALQRLIVFDNKLTKLPDSIGDLSFLEQLSLQYNNLTELPDSIGKIRWLESLDLSNNNLSELPKSIGKLGSLEDLYLYNNPISAKEVKRIKKMLPDTYVAF